MFDFFDTGGTGDLTVIELHELISIVCGPTADSIHHLDLEVKNMDAGNEDDISFDQFFAFVKKAPLILFPAYQVRDKLRRETLGISSWIEIGKKKTAEFGEHSIADILGSLRSKPRCYRTKDLRSGILYLLDFLFCIAIIKFSFCLLLNLLFKYDL